MGKFSAIFSRVLRSRMVYRSATLMGIAGSALAFLVQLSLWSTLIGSGVRQGVTLRDMIAYVMINTLVLALTNANLANEIGASVQDGSIIMHFLRPVGFRLFLLGSMLGENVYAALTGAVPLVALGCIVVGAPLPPGPVHLLLFLVLVALGINIMFQLVFVVGMLAFWTQGTWYLSWYLRAGVTLFGGTAVPLWFYPDLLSRLSRWLPFRYITFEAIEIYLGKISPEQAGASAAAALLWGLVLYGIGQLLWMRAQKKLTINGG